MEVLLSPTQPGSGREGALTARTSGCQGSLLQAQDPFVFMVAGGNRGLRAKGRHLNQRWVSATEIAVWSKEVATSSPAFVSSFAKS